MHVVITKLSFEIAVRMATRHNLAQLRADQTCRASRLQCCPLGCQIRTGEMSLPLPASHCHPPPPTAARGAVETAASRSSSFPVDAAATTHDICQEGVRHARITCLRMGHEGGRDAAGDAGPQAILQELDRVDLNHAHERPAYMTELRCCCNIHCHRLGEQKSHVLPHST